MIFVVIRDRGIGQILCSFEHVSCFPYKFNTDENQNYIGPYPDKAYYGYDEMKKTTLDHIQTKPIMDMTR